MNICLIPARIGSGRLPTKALLPINGMPLVIHTYKRAKLSKLLDEVLICTDSKKINSTLIGKKAHNHVSFYYSKKLFQKKLNFIQYNLENDV